MTRKVAGILAGAALLGALLFGAAGTLLWWNGWLFVGVMIGLGVLSARAVARFPGLDEERRTAASLAPRWDRHAVRLLALALPATVIVAGLDRRMGWVPAVPAAVSAAGRLRGREGGRLPGPLRSALEDCFAQYLAAGPAWAFEPAILHGDLGPGHVLVDPDRAEITGVIDWGDAMVGDPARDFIFVYENWGRDFLVPALEGYGRESPERLLPRVHLAYLADQLAWTLRAAGSERSHGLAHGVAALEAGVRDFLGATGGRTA